MTDIQLLVVGVLAVLAVFFFVKQLVKMAVWFALLAAIGFAVFTYIA